MNNYELMLEDLSVAVIIVGLIGFLYVFSKIILFVKILNVVNDIQKIKEDVCDINDKLHAAPLADKEESAVKSIEH